MTGVQTCALPISEKRPLWYLMPDGVVQYVSKRRLYRKPAAEGAEKALHQPSSTFAAKDET